MRGRLHRLYDGKRDVRIYDYSDLNVPMLARMFDRRCRGYEAIGLATRFSFRPVRSQGGPEMSCCRRIRFGSRITRGACEGSFVTELTPHWRTSSSTPLGHTSRREGADRARSATEAFLYRRLE